MQPNRTDNQSEPVESVRQRVNEWLDAPWIATVGKIRNLYWLLEVFLGVIVIVWALAALLGEERLLLIASVILLVLAIVELGYIRLLKRQRTDLLRKHERALGAVAEAEFRLEQMEMLMSACRVVDDQVMKSDHRAKADLVRERSNAIAVALYGCSENILPQIRPDQRRLAFLEYTADSGHYAVSADVHLAPESKRHVLEKLTGSCGFASLAQHHPERELVYEPDVSTQEAKERGYVQTTATPSKGSICCIGVWENDRFRGVVSVDCPEPHAFTEDDQNVIRVFARKVAMIYSVYPDDA